MVVKAADRKLRVYIQRRINLPSANRLQEHLVFRRLPITQRSIVDRESVLPEHQCVLHILGWSDSCCGISHYFTRTFSIPKPESCIVSKVVKQAYRHISNSATIIQANVRIFREEETTLHMKLAFQKNKGKTYLIQKKNKLLVRDHS